MDLAKLKDPSVRAEAAKLKGQLPTLQAGSLLAAHAGCWTIFKMDVDAGLQHIAELADHHQDAAMLQRLLSAISFPDRWIFVWYRVDADGRARVAVAQLYRVLRGDRSYATIQPIISNLETNETQLRLQARDPDLLSQLDDPRSYLGASKLVQTESGAAGAIVAHHEEWYLNQAILMGALEAATDPEVKSRLAVIMLQGFNKAAKVNEGETLGYLSTPFSDGTSTNAYALAPSYHRSVPTNQLVSKCTEAIQAKMGLDTAQWFVPRPVHNVTFKEVVRRVFSFKNVATRCDTEADFKAAIDRLLQLLQAGEICVHPVGFDVSALHAAKGDALGAHLEALFQERKKAFLDQVTLSAPQPFDPAPIGADIAKLRSRLFAFVFTTFTPPAVPDGPSLDAALAAAVDAPPSDLLRSCGELVKRVAVNPRLSVKGRAANPDSFVRPTIDLMLLPRQFTGAGPDSLQPILQGIDQALVHSGYRMDPFQTKKIWAAMKSYKQILADCKIELTKLATSSNKVAVVCPSFRDFLGRAAVTRFAALDTDAARPYVAVLSAATMALLRGLLDYQHTEVMALRAFTTRSAAIPPYAGTGTVTVSPPMLVRQAFRDVACTQPAGPLAADALAQVVPLYLRGAPEDDLVVQLALAPSDDERIVVGDRASCRPFGDLPDPDGRSGIDRSYHQKGLTDLLQTSYFRMLTAMTTAADHKHEIVPFLNQIEIIHQEIAAILTLVEPHARNTFELAYNQFVADGDFIPAAQRPASVHLKPSSMHCLASTAGGVEAVAGTHQLKVLFLEDCYYEGDFALHEWRSFTRFTLKGDTSEIMDGLTPLLLTDGSGGSIPKDDARWLPVKPLHLFVCDFHHNIAPTRNHYKVEDLVAQVGMLYAKELVAPRFTVAIDCTIDFIRTGDVKAFLEAFADKITAGTLNVVLLRSAQKFDMLGMDNFYGGYTVSINKAADFTAFNARMADPQDQLEGANRQGLSHLMRYAAKWLDTYRDVAMKNTKRLYDALPAGCKFGSVTPSHLVISKIEDPRCAFLDIKFPQVDAAGGGEAAISLVVNAFETKLFAFAKKEKLPLTTRASFGFPTSNFTKISGSKLRLNPGLEPSAVMDQYASFFSDLHAHLQSLTLDKPLTYVTDLVAGLQSFSLDG